VNKIKKYDLALKLAVTQGQVRYEFNHLLNKLKNRDPKKHEEIKNEKEIEVNPIF